MLKAIIVDFDGDYLIVANSRGDFKRIYNNYTGCQVGDEITVKNSRTAIFGLMLSSMSGRKALAIAACFLLMIVTSYGVYGNVNPVTYVTVDINPSVEFSLNRYNLVLDARGLNDEGNVIVGNGKEYRNMKLDKAFNLLLLRAMEFNYLNMDTNTVMLAVSNVKDTISPNMEKQLNEIAEAGFKINDEKTQNAPNRKPESESLSVESLNSETKKGSVVVIVENTTFEKHQEAKEMDISQGKLVLYERLKKVKPDAVLNHVKEASVTQIIKEIEKITPEKEKSNPKGKGNGDNKKQQVKDIKTLEREIKNQLKDMQKEDNKNLLKEEIKDTKNQWKNIIKDLKKETDKDLKKGSKSKKESIKDQRQDLKNNKKQDNNNVSNQGNKKIPDVSNDKANKDKNKGKNETKPRNNKK